MASASVKARPRPAREAKPGVPESAVHACPVRRVDSPTRRRIASNFAFLSAAELVCRTTSVVVTLSLAKRLGVDGYGRIEFAFNVVFWLVLLLRDSSDVIVARELSRHPRLIRPLVDQVLAYKTLFALMLFSALALATSSSASSGSLPSTSTSIATRKSHTPFSFLSCLSVSLNKEKYRYFGALLFTCFS